jgi:septal ring factor EnvC (AmiA/AmiB activator)
MFLLLYAFKIIFFVIFMTLGLQNGLIFALSSNDTGVIIVDNLNFRSMPDRNSRILAQLGRGTVVKILERKDKWLKVSHNGQTGFISNRQSFIRLATVETFEKKKEHPQDIGKQIERYKKEAESIGLEIKKETLLVDRFAQKEKDTIQSLNRADQALNDARLKITSLTVDVKGIEDKIHVNTQASAKLTNEIKTSEHYAMKRIAALYKLACLGSMQMLASSESMFELFQKKKALERILVYDENLLQEFNEKKNRLIQINKSLSDQKKIKQSAEKELEQQVQIMSEQRAKRSLLLTDIQKKKTFQLAAIQSLKVAARELDLTIQSLKGAFEQKTTEGLTMPSFESFKGDLRMPVSGKVVSFFGPFKNKEFNFVNFQKGIDIQAKRGELIRAVYGGRIIFANWFKGYGNMIIIDHGENYYTLYAHADELFTAKGNRVEKGEVIATVGDTGSISGPLLHFEVRHHGKSVDPLKWVKLN